MTNIHGEVADFTNVSQFEGGESAYECVAFSVALCHFAGQATKGPTGTPEQVDQLADQWYTKLTGSFDSSNQSGMSVEQELRMIIGVGNHYQVLSVEPNSPHDRDIANVKGALLRGYPVIICGVETGMVDIGLGDIVPYGWTPRGNHCIVASGIAKDGNLLVRDQANVDGSGVRPGPRTYDTRYLDLISAVVFVPTWMQRPDEATDFTQAPTAVVPTPTPVIPTPTPVVPTPPPVIPVVPAPTQTASQAELLATVAMLRDGIDHLLAEISKLFQKEDTHV